MTKMGAVPPVFAFCLFLFLLIIFILFLFFLKKFLAITYKLM